MRIEFGLPVMGFSDGVMNLGIRKRREISLSAGLLSTS
jgi:hypothetical protein